jgi:hypothetical protein
VSCIIPQACLEQIVPLTADFLAKMEAAIEAKVEERKRRWHEWYHEKGGKVKQDEYYHEWYHEKGGKEKNAGRYQKNKLQQKEAGIPKKQAAVAAMQPQRMEGRGTWA